MKPWLATALLFLLAVPYQTYWLDYEIARRGALALLVGVLCLFPGVYPRRVPALVWPFNALALWSLLRAMHVPNSGYAFESACHMLAIAALVLFGTGLSLRAILRAAMPAAIVVAVVGIAQGFGWSLVPDTTEAVSTLGNRNVASEVLALFGAAAALLSCDAEGTRRDRWLGLAVLSLCAFAIVLNTSRSGLLALPLGCLPCLLQRRRLHIVLALAAGIGCGFGKRLVLPLHRGPQEGGTALAIGQIDSAPPSTIEVRLELWRGTLDMYSVHPIAGFGGGQFQTEYPPYRTLRELELSSFGRRFQTAPAKAHNDYLQVLVELGLVGFLLAAAGGYLVLRVTPIRYWGPLLAFFLLAGVRAPLTNAPAAALLFLFVGGVLGRQHAAGAREFSMAPQRQIVKGIVLGLLMAWFGAGQLFSQIATTGYVERARTGKDWPGALACIEQALFFRPHDHDLRLVRARDRLKKRETLRAARRDIEFLLRIAPRLPAVKIEHAILLNAEGRPDEALKVLNLLRAMDPENQRAIQVSVLILVRTKRAPGAVELLFRSRHERTREQLAAILGGLAKQAKTTADRRLLEREQAFVETLDEMQRDPGGRAAVDAFKRFGRLAPERTDMRFFVLNARLFLAQNRPKMASSLAAFAKDRKLAPTHLRMMEPILEPLRTLPEWREVLAKKR